MPISDDPPPQPRPVTRSGAQAASAAGLARSAAQSISTPSWDRMMTISGWGMGLVCLLAGWGAGEDGRYSEAIQCAALAMILFLQIHRPAAASGTTTESTSPMRDSHSQKS